MQTLMSRRKTKMDKKDFVSKQELSRELGINAFSLERFYAEGKIKHMKIHKNLVIVPRKELERIKEIKKEFETHKHYEWFKLFANLKGVRAK
jgi:hypothetical protein